MALIEMHVLLRLGAELLVVLGLGLGAYEVMDLIGSGLERLERRRGGRPRPDGHSHCRAYAGSHLYDWEELGWG